MKAYRQYLHGSPLKHVILSRQSLGQTFPIPPDPFFLLIIHETIRTILFHVSAAVFVSCANRHFDCDSRLIATFRRVFVLPRNLLMKYRLFGDLETIQHNRQRHNERFPSSPPSFLLWRRVCSDGKRLRRKNNVERSLKKSLYSIHKVYKGKLQSLGFLQSSGPTNGCTDKSCHKTLLFIPFKGLFVCFYIAHSL